MLNRLGHRFQRRLDVPVWIERGPQGLTYARKVLAIDRDNLIAYWRLSEASGSVADNLEGTAARDAGYDADVTLGQPGIGDGRTSVLFDLSADEFVDCFTTSFRDAWDGAEGSMIAWVAYDGATYGMTLSGKISALYAQAQQLAPNNPRVILNKADWAMGSARFFGQDTAPFCKDVEKALELFTNFKPETPFHPKWGKNRAEEILESCKK